MTTGPSDLPWMPLYRGDYLRATLGWPPIARLVYLELLGSQWDRGVLPADQERLRLLVAGVSADEWATAWQYVEPQFPIDGDGRSNYQLGITRGESLAVRRSRSHASRTAARARWNGAAAPHVETPSNKESAPRADEPL